MPALRRLPSGLWQASVRLPNGRRSTKTDRSKQWVRGWGEALEADIRRGRWVEPVHTPAEPAPEPTLTVGQWREQWVASRHREMNTCRREDNDWQMRVSYWADKPLDGITRLDVQKWSTRMAKDGVGAVSHKQAIEHLRQIYRAAIEHGKVSTDPTVGVNKPTIPKHVGRILTRAEWARLDTATGGDPMVRLMLWCGLRWGEAAGLHGEAVDLERNLIWIVRVRLRTGHMKERPKSRSGNRQVPLPPDALESLRAIMRPGELFTAPEGGPLVYDNWRRRFARRVRTAGLADPQPTAHDLRRTYATWLADGGVPAHDIASLMGHADNRSTETYVHSGLVRNSGALDALRHKETSPDAGRQKRIRPLRPRRKRPTS